MNRISSRNYNHNLLLNYVFQGLALVLGMLCVRVDLNYLGKELYGLWTGVASFTTLLSLGNLGIGNGLRNQIAIAVAEENTRKINDLISQGIRTLSSVAMVICGLAIGLVYALIQYQFINQILFTPLIITVILFSVNLVLSITASISYGYQMSGLVSLTTTIGYMLQITLISGAMFSDAPATLTLYATVIGICPIAANLVQMFFLYRKGVHFKYIASSQVHENYLPAILGLGFQFFLLQVCEALLFSMDCLIINIIFDSASAAEYTLITKIYNAGDSIYSIALISLWSGVTYAIAQKDYKWITKQIHFLHRLLIPFYAGVIFVGVFTNSIIRIWSGDSTIFYSPFLVALFAAATMAKAWNGIYVNVANGLGKTTVQLAIWLVCAIANIPLSVLFGKFMHMGLFGVKLASTLAIFLSSIIMPPFVMSAIHKGENKSEQE